MSDQNRGLRWTSAARGALVCFLGIALLGPQALGDDAAGNIKLDPAGERATARMQTTTPGSRITLRLDSPVKAGSRYLWIQTMGPPLDLPERTGPELKLTVPSGALALSFLLIVADDQGIRTSDISVPIAQPASDGATGLTTAHGAKPAIKADAGDDQIGLVGRRITVNGSDSQPKAGLSYRWVQLGGPEVNSPVEVASYYSFIPSAPGVYRFALVVAHENQISAPDYVSVTVGLPPGPAALPGLKAPSSPAGALDQALIQALQALDDAPVLAAPLAAIFETSSSRMDLYQTYGEIYSELSRRLDGIIPPDPYRRARWNSAFFEPLTQQLVARMFLVGLDFRSPAGQMAHLSEPQKQELKGQFDRVAKLLRAVPTMR